MKEERKGNMIIGTAGGTAGKNSRNYKVSIPSLWAKEMGVSMEDKTLILSFEDKKIVIEKKYNGEIKNKCLNQPID